MKKLENVLVVEDELMKAERVIRILNGFGGVNYVLKTGVEEAVKEIKHTQFDLIITDLGLPKSEGSPVMKEDGKNGLKMMLDLANREIRIPTIVYSTNWIYKAEEKALKEVNYPFIAQVIDSAMIEWYICREFEINGSG